MINSSQHETFFFLIKHLPVDSPMLLLTLLGKMPFGVWIFFLRSGETTFRIFFFLPNSIHVREKGNCCLEKPEAKFANEIKILINYCNIYLKGFIFITYLTNRCFPWCKNTLIFFSFHTSTNCFCVIYCTVGYLPRELMQSLIWKTEAVSVYSVKEWIEHSKLM